MWFGFNWLFENRELSFLKAKDKSSHPFCFFKCCRGQSRLIKRAINQMCLNVFIPSKYEFQSRFFLPSKTIGDWLMFLLQSMQSRLCFSFLISIRRKEVAPSTIFIMLWNQFNIWTFSKASISNLRATFHEPYTPVQLWFYLIEVFLCNCYTIKLLYRTTSAKDQHNFNTTVSESIILCNEF